MDKTEAAEEFQRHRPRLLGIAYRMLGSMWDAEDVVEDAAIRWLDTDADQVREPVAFLNTMVSRLAVDHLRSARVRRESYYGPWLPEPALTESAPFGPVETIEQKESISLPTLRLMEQLTPPERAVFVLRSAFDLPYEEIGKTLEISEANARQLYRRARSRLDEDRSRFDSDPHEHQELLSRFLKAASDGDLEGLRDLLATDIVVYNDGGGKVRAAQYPVVGLEKVLRFFQGLLARYPLGSDIRIVEANGLPAVLLTMGDQRNLVALDVRQHKIHGIFAVLNPDKLSHLPSS